ncbi:MAG: DNA repair protein RecN [Atopostipes suicloacalis]|nr:DNA repair protein RecN [Atopostipes suicloacalis]
MIQREIYSSGRSVCRVNGSLVTIALLKKIGSFLIDIHGQNEHQELMQEEHHIQLLDSFGDQKIKKLRTSYQSIFKEYQSARRKYREWKDREQELAQKMDILKFQTEEIAEANLVIGEEEKLEEEERRLANFQNITQSLSTSYQLIQENEPGALELLGRAMDEMRHIEDLDQELKEISKLTSTTFYQLQELASEMYNLLDEQEYDEDRLNEIAGRLNIIQQMKRKYGSSIAEILDFYEESVSELEEISQGEFSKSELAGSIKDLGEKLMLRGKELSELRRQVALDLEDGIHEQLKELYMKKVDFLVQFDEELENLKLSEANAMGLDKITFYISTNPGEPKKALTKIASGGELSRMMLAMKTIFTKTQGVTSVIFDEIDTGVSGRVAQAIAEKIYSISQQSQVLCITHLPQVAARADNHLYVRKEISKDRTSTNAELLIENERIEEIARMLSGSEITGPALEAAKELRKNAKK